jgi:SAM-dependent methyltransferase
MFGTEQNVHSDFGGHDDLVEGPTMNDAGRWHKLLLTAHVTASVGVLGADLVLLNLGFAGLSGAAPATIYPAARIVGESVVAPLALTALGTGVWLSVSTPWRLFRYWWVAIKLAITLALTAAVLFVLLPALGTAADAVAAGAKLGTRERVPLFAAPAVASSLLLLAAALGIFKPRWKVASLGRSRGVANGHRGIDFPRLYDLLMTVLTRGRERAYRHRLLDLAAIAPGDDVLDIGCGTGTQAVAAWNRAQPGGSVTGVDVSERMLEAARRKARCTGAAVSFVSADAIHLPFAGESFDVIIAATVLHMLREHELEPCLEEAFRVLRRGGRLILVDYAGRLERRRHWSARVGPHGRFDLETLRAQIEKAGFEDIAGGPVDWLSLHFLVGWRKR